VYVNRQPSDEAFPENVVFVGSDEIQGGTLETEELARQMHYQGRVAIMMGELATNGARFRTKATEDVVAKYPKMAIVARQVGNWQRERGLDLMNNWLTTGQHIDAVVSNNDEMAIGAVMAMRQARVRPGSILVGGIDATPDALAEIAKGTMAVTVFQNAKGQGVGAVDAAVTLAKGEHVQSFVWIPFELVTRSYYQTFLKR
jgi:inositol transport system substrate-binding protein